jgi:hypothetical protein
LLVGHVRVQLGTDFSDARNTVAESSRETLIRAGSIPICKPRAFKSVIQGIDS